MMSSGQRLGLEGFRFWLEEEKRLGRQFTPELLHSLLPAGRAHTHDHVSDEFEESIAQLMTQPVFDRLCREIIRQSKKIASSLRRVKKQKDFLRCAWDYVDLYLVFSILDNMMFTNPDSSFLQHTVRKLDGVLDLLEEGNPGPVDVLKEEFSFLLPEVIYPTSPNPFHWT